MHGSHPNWQATFRSLAALLTVLTMPTPALAFRFAREFRRLVEKLRHLRPLLFGNRESYLREYDLLAVEVGQRRLGRPELVQRVGKPYPTEEPRTVLQRDARSTSNSSSSCICSVSAGRRSAIDRDTTADAKILPFVVSFI
jgi:hypothetical protein